MKRAGLIVGGVIVFIILLAIIGGSSSNNNSAQTTSGNNQPSLCSDIASLKSQATTVDFKELDKDPESFNGKIVKFTGQVLQIQESNGYGIVRLAVTKESYGWSSADVVYIEYQGHTDAVEDDVVTAYGQLTGSKTYESQAHFEITVPSMTACVVEKGTGITQSAPATQKTTSAGQTKTQTTQQPTTPTASAPTPTPTPTPQTNSQNTSSASNVTVSQQNALRAAQSYLNYTAFSHDGLVAQLVHDQFSQSDAVYGADNVGADWNAQAIKSAQSYLNYTAFSHDGLVAQLVHDQFTQSQAVYGADNSGANWNEQAAKSAKQYMSYSAFSRGSLIAQLEYDKFTEAQAEYGANAVGL